MLVYMLIDDLIKLDDPWLSTNVRVRKRCRFCGIYVFIDKKGRKIPLERCHVKPRSWGGTSDPINIIILCRKCHISFDRFVGVLL